MIRINLLGIKREASKSRVPTVSMEGAKATALFIGIIAVAVLVLAGDYTRLTRDQARLEKAVAAEEAERKRLEGIKAEFDKFEKRRQLLSKRIDIIEGLKKGQTGPVVMLNTLASTVQASGPLWLTAFENTGGKVTMQGVAASVNVVADFITNLKRSGQFKNVEIKESFEDERSKEISTFIFSISADLDTGTTGSTSGAKT